MLNFNKKILSILILGSIGINSNAMAADKTVGNNAVSHVGSNETINNLDKMSNNDYEKIKESLMKNSSVIDLKNQILKKKAELLKSRVGYIKIMNELNRLEASSTPKAIKDNEVQKYEKLKKEVYQEILTKIKDEQQLAKTAKKTNDSSSSSFSFFAEPKKTIYDDVDNIYLTSTFMDINHKRTAKILTNGSLMVVTLGDNVAPGWKIYKISSNKLVLKHKSGVIRNILSKPMNLILQEIKNKQAREDEKYKNKLEIEKMKAQQQSLPVAK